MGNACEARIVHSKDSAFVTLLLVVKKNEMKEGKEPKENILSLPLCTQKRGVKRRNFWMWKWKKGSMREFGSREHGSFSVSSSPSALLSSPPRSARIVQCAPPFLPPSSHRLPFSLFSLFPLGRPQYPPFWCGLPMNPPILSFLCKRTLLPH